MDRRDSAQRGQGPAGTAPAWTGRALRGQGPAGPAPAWTAASVDRHSMHSAQREQPNVDRPQSKQCSAWTGPITERIEDCAAFQAQQKTEHRQGGRLAEGEGMEAVTASHSVPAMWRSCGAGPPLGRACTCTGRRTSDPHGRPNWAPARFKNCRPGTARYTRQAPPAPPARLPAPVPALAPHPEPEPDAMSSSKYEERVCVQWQRRCRLCRRVGEREVV